MFTGLEMEDLGMVLAMDCQWIVLQFYEGVEKCLPVNSSY